MTKTKIEWTHMTWNPVTGCSKISPGCKNCYAERFALRLQRMGHAKYSKGFKVTLHEEELRRPYSWKKPAMVFVNSMSDLFHEEVPLEFVQKVFRVMNSLPYLQFQVLTKRSRRLVELSPYLEWTPNVWIGVSVENQNYVCRIEDLLRVPARIRFISFEPLIGPVKDFPSDGIDWVIVGGESGYNARPMKKEWVLRIRNICLERGIPFFFKQWGGKDKNKGGRLLEGRLYEEYPELMYSLIK